MSGERGGRARWVEHGGGGGGVCRKGGLLESALD